MVPTAKCLIVAPDVRTSPTAHINPVAALQVRRPLPAAACRAACMMHGGLGGMPVCSCPCAALKPNCPTPQELKLHCVLVVDARRLPVEHSRPHIWLFERRAYPAPASPLQRILRAAEASKVPVIFALSRRGIGQVRSQAYRAHGSSARGLTLLPHPPCQASERTHVLLLLHRCWAGGGRPTLSRRQRPRSVGAWLRPSRLALPPPCPWRLQVFGRDKSMSIVAIMHLEGLAGHFDVMLEEAIRVGGPYS